MAEFLGTLSIREIRELTGHNTDDAVRMALRRANVKANGIELGTKAWPPKKTYPLPQIWSVFEKQIMLTCATDEDMRAKALKHFPTQIATALAQNAPFEAFLKD